jgi:ubiquinone/menaquinone biosynthesis C-methylase UbiE
MIIIQNPPMFSTSAAQRAAIKPQLDRLFPNFRTGGDYYRVAIKSRLIPGVTVLDAGCGQGGIITEFRPDINCLVGADLDLNALDQNPNLDERLFGDLAVIGKPDASIDLVVGEFVLEHLADPAAVLNELKRVIKPGGAMIWLTPNIRHPVMALSRLTPRIWHDWWKRKVLNKTEKVHAAHYRANTPETIKALTNQAGLRLEKIELAGNPEYLAVTRLMISPSIRLEKYLRDHHSTRQMYMVIVMKK